MKLLVLVAALAVAAAAAAPTAHNVHADTQFIGFERNGVEVFLGIPYGQDTSGQNRFKPPRPYVPSPGSAIDATKPGHACPQQLGHWNAPLTLLNVTRESISEDCLNLNIVRPKNTMGPATSYPVMVWIHGVFGFAQSGALRHEKSENAGLRDQRLAIEWVRDNIHYFGGNGSEITIHGQSSGGLAVGVQLLAYGGEKPLPYQRGICQSQALEPGITGNFTRDAMVRVIEYLGCNPGNCSTDAPEVIACLRGKDTQTLFDASASTYSGDIAHNIGDIWLPSIDGDFLPAPISTLIQEGRFGDATYMFGWAQGDVNYFTDINIRTETAAQDFLEGYLPLTKGQRTFPGQYTLTERYLKLYPLELFTPPQGTNLTREFYQTARVFRDILMVCEPLLLARAIHNKGNMVYLYNFNQTLLDPIIEYVSGIKGMGVVHTSEFAYIFGNLSHYNVSGYPFNPTEADYTLATRASRSWGHFAHSGFPSPLQNTRKALKGWLPAFWSFEDDLTRQPGRTYVYTIGGPSEGLWPLDGPDSIEPVSIQQIEEKCALFNDPRFIKLLQF
ncbi:hypothetical protein N0V90_006130 [Kalmusia sp. IMI 367209]|nr:hypothetical protein N0V90_006130 [Kalmusia sp. IMI 367209]